MPVLDDIAEDMYHSEHSMQKRSILEEAFGAVSVRLRGASKKWNSFDNDDQLRDVKERPHGFWSLSGAQLASQLGPCLRFSLKMGDAMPLCLSSVFPKDICASLWPACRCSMPEDRLGLLCRGGANESIPIASGFAMQTKL